ncbi:hypothetical protein [Priestia koreensis]|uniref:Uncharacterized protein n=1 Tax=Priestia koreensis TaxID=284581 RepID=A0A0M0KW57_9BACI|nr:hypothetical protein [Priestia koreensis]KOO43055.1 hypothetical protein AMD01_18220 [Priestia koreensis]
MLEEIDGAKVIKYTETDEFGFIEYEDGEKKDILTLAICNYDNKEEYYLFACDKQFNVLGDTLHGSVEEAMDFAKRYYEKEMIDWK